MGLIRTSANNGERWIGGGSGIRTHDTVSRIHAFQACALSHSAIPPGLLRRGQYNAGRSDNKPAPRSRDLPQRRERNRSINPTHVARLAYVVAAEFARAVAERRRANEVEQRLQPRQEIVALAQREIEALPCERHEIEPGCLRHCASRDPAVGATGAHRLRDIGAGRADRSRASASSAIPARATSASKSSCAPAPCGRSASRARLATMLATSLSCNGLLAATTSPCSRRATAITTAS